MPPETSQEIPVDGGENMANLRPEMTPDEAAASLAFATNLSDGMLEASNPNPEMEQTEEGEGEKEEGMDEDSIRNIVREELQAVLEESLNNESEAEG